MRKSGGTKFRIVESRGVHTPLAECGAEPHIKLRIPLRATFNSIEYPLDISNECDDVGVLGA